MYDTGLFLFLLPLFFTFALQVLRTFSHRSLAEFTDTCGGRGWGAFLPLPGQGSRLPPLANSDREAEDSVTSAAAAAFVVRCVGLLRANALRFFYQLHPSFYNPIHGTTRRCHTARPVGTRGKYQSPANLIKFNEFSN